MPLSELHEIHKCRITDFDPGRVQRGTIARFEIHLVTDGIGQPTYVPVMVARGNTGDKVFGCTAAVHGNELNGIPVIQRLFQDIDPGRLNGTIVGVPIVNVPSFLRKKRRFIDDKDLNHIMPGKENGNVSEVYAWRLVNHLVRHFDYLLDLHTASFGRINSYYVRANMDHAITAEMAKLQNPQIILHDPPTDGTLRGAAAEMGIHAITAEVGDPNTFQRGMIGSSLTGIHNLLSHLEFVQGMIEYADAPPIVCSKSYWIYTNTGGILRVKPQVTQRISKGEVIATLHNIFGDLVDTYVAPEDGVVIGKSVSPICPTGGRILHLGIID